MTSGLEPEDHFLRSRSGNWAREHCREGTGFVPGHWTGKVGVLRAESDVAV